MTAPERYDLPGFVQMARDLGLTLASEDAQRLALIIGTFVRREREACAQHCYDIWYSGSTSSDDAHRCYEAIRARR